MDNETSPISPFISKRAFAHSSPSSSSLRQEEKRRKKRHHSNNENSLLSTNNATSPSPSSLVSDSGTDEEEEEEEEEEEDAQSNKENEAPTKTPPPNFQALSPSLQTDSDSDLSSQVAKAKRALLRRICEKDPPLELVGLEDQYKKIFELLERTVQRGESNSCLIFGARGSGKTTVLRRALQSLAKQSSDAIQVNAESKKSFLQIQLSGLTQTDDKLALREIARQMAIETNTEEDGVAKASFANALAHLLDVFRSSGREAVPIIFILDEFDLFAEHPRQSLLYTLLDICQGAKSPVAVVGTTCRLNALELLEKRVKSRFSHRQIYLPPPETFGAFLKIGLNTLQLQPNEVDDEKYRQEFNSNVAAIFDHQSFIKVTRRIFDLGKDVRTLYRTFFQPVSQLSSEEPFFNLEWLCESGHRQHVDSKAELLLGVSVLELCLIIAMKRHYEREIQSFNFEMIYDEYKEFMDKAHATGHVGLKRATKPVAMKAFEHLQSFELVRPVESVVRCPKEYRMTRLLLEPAQVAEAVMKHPQCPMLVQKWATKWIP